MLDCQSPLTYAVSPSRPLDADGVLLTNPQGLAEWGVSPAQVQALLDKQGWKGKLGDLFVLPHLESGRTFLLVGTAYEAADGRGRHEEVEAPRALRELAAHLTRQRVRHLAVEAQGADADGWVSHLVRVLEMAYARLPHFQSRDDRHVPERITVVGDAGLGRVIERERILATATNLVRGLTRLPSDRLTPDSYQAMLEKLAEDGLEVTVWDQARLKAMGAGGMLAVGQAGGQGARIVRLRYAPPGKPLVQVVGKGVVFDTGGLSLKAPKYMLGMHDDMSGSAVAAAIAWAAAQLKLPFGVESYLGIVENLIGPQSFRPGDVITLLNGKTVEIVDTDAEGRLVLADALALAQREGEASLILDYATLTGSCLKALGSIASGVWSNRESLYPICLEAGYAAGERVWPFPNWPDYKKPLESKVADLKQCTVDGAPDMSHAFAFLNECVRPEIPYVHVDLAAVSDDDGLGPAPGGYTGFGVRFGLELIPRLLA